MFNGSNELSSAEIELIKAYKALGRPDLADCVILGKPFQWLSMIGFTVGIFQYHYLKALGESLGCEMEDDMESFLQSKRGKFKLDS